MGTLTRGETTGTGSGAGGITAPARARIAFGILVVALTLGGCRSQPTRLAPLLDQDAPNVIPGQYLVVFEDGASRDAVEAGKAVARRFGGKVGFTYTSALVGFSAELPPPALAAMRALPDVAFVEADKRFSYETVQPPNPPAAPTPSLDRIDRRMLPLNGTYAYSETGAGVNVYVIDSGIRTTHSEFGGRATAAFSVTPDLNDCRGHGTHVAAIIGGATYGVAKEVNLHSVRIGGLFCSPDDSNIIAGIDWVTTNRVNPAVVNLSVGGPPPSTAMDRAVALSISTGLTYVIAAGNFGEDACRSSPGRVPAAITVGAVDARTDRRWVSSNVGQCIDLFAPGVDVLSAWNGSDMATDTKSGTSQAAPFVTGAVARFLQNNRQATPSQVWAALRASNNVSTTANWPGVVDRGTNSPNELLYVFDATPGATTGFVVPATDATPPSTLWLQIDRPNRPLLNAYPDSADPPARAAPGVAMRVTARSNDNDGGLKDVQIWMTEQRWSQGTLVGPGLAGAPVANTPSSAGVGDPARTSASVSYSLTPPANLGPGQGRRYTFFARAENFHGGVAESRWLVIDVP